MFIRQFLKELKVIPLKIHNGGSYGLMEYLTCWKCVIFHAVMAFLFIMNGFKAIYLIEKQFTGLINQHFNQL